MTRQKGKENCRFALLRLPGNWTSKNHSWWDRAIGSPVIDSLAERASVERGAQEHDRRSERVQLPKEWAGGIRCLGLKPLCPRDLHLPVTCSFVLPVPGIELDVPLVPVPIIGLDKAALELWDKTLGFEPRFQLQRAQ